eukprot:GHVU01129763.1.p2 GENE.GHVU01129763.1~~GHVU01129763.1.p2  ORF type:complete len:169 (+),score=14.77 GHVU01129763.1:508-1014(+)
MDPTNPLKSESSGKQGQEYGSFYPRRIVDIESQKGGKGGGQPGSASDGDGNYRSSRQSTSILTPDTIKTLVFFSLWYFFNVMYNIDNKKALNLIPLPYTVSVVQLFTGWFYFIPLWILGFRPMPRFHGTSTFVAKIIPQGVCHAMVHVAAVVSLGTHVLVTAPANVKS